MDPLNFSLDNTSDSLDFPLNGLFTVKSTSTIDQFSLHHAKGDSACSSFSGDSNTDYGSHSLSDENQPHRSLSADLKYTKVYNSSDVPESKSKSLDHLYCSMKDPSERHHYDPCLSGQHLSQGPPPAPPYCLDSFIPIKNLEISRTSQNLESQLIAVSNQRSQMANGPGQGQSQSNQRNLVSCNSFSEEIQYQGSENGVQVMSNDSIQHKGQYYFVTGVRRSSETPIQNSHSSFTESESWDTFSGIPPRFTEIEKICSTADDLKNVNCLCQDVQIDQEEFLQSQDFNSRNHDEGHQSKGIHGPSYFSSQGFQLFDGLEHSQTIQSRETSWQNGGHQIIYCGQEEGITPSSFNNKDNISSLDPGNINRTNHSGRVVTQSIREAATGEINKETTPMLSHLTGESMGTQDSSAHRQQFHEESGLRADIGSAGNNIQKRTFKNHTQEMGDIHSDSFRRHYKENIEDVQSKVLKETSFMRKDLQLSWPQSFTLGSDQTFSNVSSISCLQDPQVTLENSILSEPDIQGKEGREQNLPQIQVVRITGRKSLTPEQRKLCYSDTEKLDLLEDTPYRLCSSLDTHEVKIVSEDGQAKQGLVATRRKIFETKGRALSTSCLSKTTLKHIQHEALVAYMERRMGQKPTESQNIIEQPAINVHSMAGKVSVWGMRPQSGKSRNTLARHHSSGHLLDSSSTNEQAWLSNSRETISSAPGKPAFAESLLNQAEEGGFFRARSISIPHGFQHVKKTSASSPINIPQTFSSSYNEDATVLLRKSQVVSVMDNCVAGLSAPSKTTPGELEVQGVSMPLEQPRSRQAARGRNKSTSLYREGEVKAQGCMHRKSFFNQESAPELGVREDFSGTGSCQSKANAISQVSPPGKVCCFSSCSGRSFYGDGPLSLHLCNMGSAKGELSKAKSAPSATPDQDHIESRNSPRIKTCLPGNLSHLELSVDDPEENASPSFSQEMCLSRGVTIDQDSMEAGMCAQKENLSPQSDACSNKAPVLAAEPLRACSTPFHDQKEKAEEEEKGVSMYKHVVHACPEAKTKVRSPWEELVEDVVAEDQSLAHVLFPAINRKTTVSLMEQLLSEDTLLMDEHYRRKQTQMSCGKQQTIDSPVMVERFETITPPCSTYSTPIDQQKGRNQVKVESDATEKKRLLVACIKQHLRVLEQSRAALQEEVRMNGEQAEAVAALVQAKCLPAEYVRYTQFVGDLERVVSLMLCLSARLARVQNALSVVDQNTDAEDRESLANRHRLLCKQREDAQDLKNNLDRRERTVSTILSKYLTLEQLQDYRHCVQIKASLLIQQKDLDEKKRLAEEQLESLLNSAPCQGTYMLSPNKCTVPPTVPM